MKEVIQVAGVIDVQEAQMLLDSGVDWLGFPFRLPVHSEDLTTDAAAAIIDKIEAPKRGIVITYLQQPGDIVALCDQLRTTSVQLHGSITLAALAQLRTKRPDLYIMKSLVIGESPVKELEKYLQEAAPFVDAFITDSYDSATGARGATGKIHDWKISRRFVGLSPKPVMLAGGLNAENIGLAIRAVDPAGVDAHTGLEDVQGRKDANLVAAFVREARKAFASRKGQS